MAYFDRATFGLDFIACIEHHERIEAAMRLIEEHGDDGWHELNTERLANAGKMADLVVQVVAHAMGGRG